MVAHCHVVRCVTVLYIVPRTQSETVYDSVAEQHSEEKQNGLWHSGTVAHPGLKHAGALSAQLDA